MKMSAEDLPESLKAWTNEELYCISKVSLSLSHDSLEMLNKHKMKDAINFIKKYVMPQSFVRVIRDSLAASKHCSAQEVCLQPESDLNDKDKLLEKFWHLSAKKTYLQKSVQNLEDEVVCVNAKLGTLNDRVSEHRQTLAAISMSQHFFREKVTMLKKLTNDMQFASQKITLSSSSSEPQGFVSFSNNIVCSKSISSPSSFAELYNTKSYLDIKAVLEKLGNFYQHTDSMNETNLAYRKVCLEVNTIINSYIAHDILTYLKGEHELHTEVIESYKKEISKNRNVKLLTHITHIPSDKEIKILKLRCVKLFVAKASILKEIKDVNYKKELVMKSLANEMQENTEMKMDLLNALCRISTSPVAVDCLKELLFNVERLKNYQHSCDDDIRQVNNSHLTITTINQSLNRLLNQNNFVFKLIAEKHAFIPKSTLDFLLTEKSSLVDIVAKINYNVPLIKNVEIVSQSINNKCTVANSLRVLLHDLGLLHFQDVYVILENLLSLLFNGNDYIVQLRNKTLHRMKPCGRFLQPSLQTQSKCEKRRIEEQRMLEELFSQIVAGIKLKESEKLLVCKIDDIAKDWWQQPAQFIPRISINDKTLQQFITCLESPMAEKDMSSIY